MGASILALAKSIYYESLPKEYKVQMSNCLTLA